ncbi:MAG: type II toxin-antitoxin system RelE/ParE family toxin [Ekhidna sp.]|nr:type II toxin-antitoxin system RelE/ParE family toxin [Ekhidna sp.]
MSFDIIATDPFKRKLKKLSKKYRSLKSDLLPVIEELAENPKLGTPLGKECYKIRVAISSKGKGKSGGARIITYVRILKETVFLIYIYDKSEQSTISNKELKLLIELLAED